MKVCGFCKENKEDSEFAKKETKPDGRVVLQYQCKECQSAYRKKHYKQHRSKYLKKARKWETQRKDECYSFLFEYFKTHPCLDCGETNPIVLEFDHIRGTKVKNVSQMVSGSQEKLEREIEKCEVVCANCHRKRTAKRGNWRWLKLITDE